MPRLVELSRYSRYSGAHQTEDTGGVDVNLKTVRAKGTDYVVDLDSFIVFSGEDEVGTWDDASETVALYDDIVNQEQVRDVVAALLGQLGVLATEEGVPPSGTEQLLGLVTGRVVSATGQAVQLAGVAKSSLTEKALSSVETMHTSAVQAEAMYATSNPRHYLVCRHLHDRLVVITGQSGELSK